MQALGRRYVAAHNRRHGRRGTLWDGRFRCGVVEPGATRLQALCLIDGAAADRGITSAAHRLGGPRDALLVDPPEYWQLGNTPFEREAAYRRLLQAGVPPAAAQALRSAAIGGWAAGSPGFKASLAMPSRGRHSPARAAGPGAERLPATADQAVADRTPGRARLVDHGGHQARAPLARCVL